MLTTEHHQITVTAAWESSAVSGTDPVSRWRAGSWCCAEPIRGSRRRAHRSACGWDPHSIGPGASDWREQTESGSRIKTDAMHQSVCVCVCVCVYLTWACVCAGTEAELVVLTQWLQAVYTGFLITAVTAGYGDSILGVVSRHTNTPINVFGITQTKTIILKYRSIRQNSFYNALHL